MDGSGVPMVKKETVGRQGKQEGQAKTREAKLGCVFTQTSVDKEGRPIRDELSTSYTGAIEGAEPFGWRIYKYANERWAILKRTRTECDMLSSERGVFLSDQECWKQDAVPSSGRG